MVNRKLIRPNLAEVKERFSARPKPEPQRASAGNGGSSASHASGHSSGHAASTAVRRRPAPAEQTNAEAFYYLKQMNTVTPMVLILDNGEELRGHIEWYDKGCLKVHREGDPNLLVFKHSIRYLYKQEDE